MDSIVDKEGEKLDIVLETKGRECYTKAFEDDLSSESVLCPTYWDSILCWPLSEPGQIIQSCPDYIQGFKPQHNAYQVCLENGTWHNWTNYTECATTHFLLPVPTTTNDTGNWEQHTYQIMMVSDIGYGISAVALIIAFAILASFKRLRCPRNKLHLHLFLSFILRASATFIKRATFENGLGPRSTFLETNGTMHFHEEKHWECKTMTTVWQYTILANYSWIFVEGLYIHNLIIRALSADGSSTLLYILLGWGLPLIVIPVWVTARILFENTFCWTTQDVVAVECIITVPTVLSIQINFFLFVNIVRVLMSKVRTSIQAEAQRYWRLAKSLLILVALFGVPHYLTIGLYFVGDVTSERIWLYSHQIFASFQGFFMALLYCFLNSEVQEELKKKWMKYIYKGRVSDNNLPTTSFASWSSSLSMAHRTCSLACLRHTLRRVLACGYRPESRASKNSETVDCMVPCDTCSAHFNPQAPQLGGETCGRQEHDPDDESAVEMKLMSKAN